jgi:NitT/TauT family transport system substrate-binding protein
LRKIIILFVIISILIVGCTPAEEPPKTSGEVMKVSNQYWPGGFWITIANEKGWFEEAGLNVVVTDVSDDLFKGFSEFVDGKADTFVAYPLFDMIQANVNGADLVAVVNADISFGGDVIVAKKDITRMAELKGKKVAVPKHTFLDFMLISALKKHNLNEDDIIQVSSEFEDISSFINGEVDAIATFEPFGSEAVEKGDGRIIFSSQNIPGLIPDLIMFHRSFIDEKPEDVQAYVNVWHRTSKYIKQNPDEAFAIISEFYKVPVGDLLDFSQGVKLLDLRDNTVAFSYAAGYESLHGTARQINDFMKDNGITDKNLDSTEFIDARFIRGVEE